MVDKSYSPIPHLKYLYQRLGALVKSFFSSGEKNLSERLNFDKMGLKKQKN